MAPMHDVAPSAVTIAVAIDAIICTINFNVSFLLITLIFYWLIFWLGFLDEPSGKAERHGSHLEKRCSFFR